MLKAETYIGNRAIFGNYKWDKYVHEAPEQHFTSIKNEHLMKYVKWDDRYIDGYISLIQEEKELLGSRHRCNIDFAWLMILKGIEDYSNEGAAIVNSGENEFIIEIVNNNDNKVIFKNHYDKVVQSILPEKEFIENLAREALLFFQIAHNHGYDKSGDTLKYAKGVLNRIGV